MSVASPTIQHSVGAASDELKAPVIKDALLALIALQLFDGSWDPKSPGLFPLILKAAAKAGASGDAALGGAASGGTASGDAALGGAASSGAASADAKLGDGASMDAAPAVDASGGAAANGAASDGAASVGAASDGAAADGAASDGAASVGTTSVDAAPAGDASGGAASDGAPSVDAAPADPEKICRQFCSKEGALRATALAIVAMRIGQSERREEWAMIEEKAVDWLKETIESADAGTTTSAEQLLKEAENVLKSAQGKS